MILKLIVSPLVSTLKAVRRLVTPGLRSVLSTLLTVIIFAWATPIIEMNPIATAVRRTGLVNFFIDGYFLVTFHAFGLSVKLMACSWYLKPRLAQRQAKKQVSYILIKD